MRNDSQAAEYAKINRHLQNVGTATCDVGNLIMQADDMRESGDSRAAFMLMSAARDVLHHREQARRARSRAAYAKRKRLS